MSIQKKIRKTWHDLFYGALGEKGEKLAMTCQVVAEMSDIGLSSYPIHKRFRFYLHMSLCKACLHYRNLNRVLRILANGWLGQQDEKIVIEKLNGELLERHVRR